MPEEPVAEPVALVCAFDQPGNVGDDEASFVTQADHPEIGSQGGERVVCDLGSCRRDSRDQSRFSGVGEADEPHVGQQLEPEPQIPDFARTPRLRAPRRLVGRAGEVLVAAPADPALGDHDALSLGAARCLERGVEPVGDQGVQMRAHRKIHRAPAAAVAAVGTATRRRLLAMKAQTATTAVTGGHVDVDFVDEHAVKRTAHRARSRITNVFLTGSSWAGSTMRRVASR